MQPALTSTKTMWLWIAWATPAGMPLSFLLAQHFGMFGILQTWVPKTLFHLALMLAPLGWLALTVASAFWIARDMGREYSTERKDGCGLWVVAFGIFCFQIIFTGGIILMTASALGD